MASRFPQENRAELRPRKGHDMTWSCDKHAEPIAFYCKEHRLPVCDRCAIKEHCQKPCELDDIEDVILERRRKLDDKQHEIEKTKKQLKTLDYKIESIATFSSNHFQTVNDEVKSTHKDKSKSVNDDEEKKISLINEEADKEIRIINEKRDGRIKACNADIERQQLIIQKSQAKLFSEAKAISKVVSKTIKDLTSKNQHAISTMDNVDAKINRIKQDDKTLVKEAPQVLASQDDILNLNVYQDVMDCLDRIQREVQRVKFVDGMVGEEHYGRIDGYIGKWELVKSILNESVIVDAILCGWISDNEICMMDDASTYVTNISTGHTQEVIDSSISTCAPLDNVIVCGKWKEEIADDSLVGCITLYDRQWKVVRDINIPRKNSSDLNSVYVDVDMDGMILAAENNQSDIYVINPADGKIVNTITMQGKVARGEIRTLSSGDIVVKTKGCDFTVISQSGEEKAVIHYAKCYASRCCVDKLTDTLYITYWDIERKIYAVDQASCDGIIEAKRIVEYKEPPRYAEMSPCFVTPTCTLVACNGDKVFVYKKRFIV